MIFLRYESFRGYLKAYPVTSVLIALNILMYIAQMASGGLNTGTLTSRFLFFQSPLDPYGLEEPWRYVTSIFVHGGLQHLLFNMFALLVFAPPLEKLLGSVRYLILYLLSGVAGNLIGAVIVTGTQLSLGASGAIYGVYGAYLFIALLRKGMMDKSSEQTVYIILLFGVVYSVINVGVDLWAHVGGAIGGFLLYGLMDKRERYRKDRYRR